MSNTSMLHIKNLSISFKGLNVLNNVSLSIQKGEVIGIVGPSGSGKSTFLKCLNLLEKPCSGDIFYDNELITSSNILKIRQQMGMVFQHFNLFNHLTILHNLTFAPVKIGRLAIQEADKKAMALLQKVGLADKAHAYPHQLSGGQKQRAAIARTLMMDPDVILFDEPTSALDPELVQEVLQVIQSFAHTGITMLIVSHEMGFIKSVVDRVLFFDAGRIVEDSPPDVFFKTPQSKRAQAFLSKTMRLA